MQGTAPAHVNLAALGGGSLGNGMIDPPRYAVFSHDHTRSELMYPLHVSGAQVAPCLRAPARGFQTTEGTATIRTISGVRLCLPIRAI